MTLRRRIVLALAPLVCLLAVIGTTGILLLRQVGDRIEEIMRENYASVEAMVGLNEALERIDSSFQFSLQGKDDAKQEYDDNWVLYRKNLDREENNITEPGEADLVAHLKDLTDEYQERGDRFFAGRPARHRTFGGVFRRGEETRPVAVFPGHQGSGRRHSST